MFRPVLRPRLVPVVYRFGVLTSKNKNAVELVTYGTELVSLRITRDLDAALRIKLRVSCVTIY